MDTTENAVTGLIRPEFHRTKIEIRSIEVKTHNKHIHFM